MFETSRRTGPIWSALAISLLGAVYSLVNALGKAESLCITTGCSLFKEFTVYGYSLWWGGLAFFCSTALLCVLGRQKIAFLLTGAALLVDTALLLFMAFSAPCVPCLGIALFIALLFFSLRPSGRSPSPQRPVLLLLWSFAFLPNLFLAANESMGTWAISTPEHADIQLFFSPSCPVCRTAVERFAADPDARIAYYPVAESEQDIRAIAVMRAALGDGTSMLIAFRRGLREAALLSPAPSSATPSPTSTNLPISLSLRWKLFRNKVRLASMGITTIPVMITNGVPRFLLAPPAGSSAPALFPPLPGESSPQAGQGGLGAFAGCDQTGEPCPE